MTPTDYAYGAPHEYKPEEAIERAKILTAPNAPGFDKPWALAIMRGLLKALEKRPEVASRDSVIRECRRVVLSCSGDAHEAAKAKDATDYVAGYQDAVVDCDEALRDLLNAAPQVPVAARPGERPDTTTPAVAARHIERIEDFPPRVRAHLIENGFSALEYLVGHERTLALLAAALEYELSNRSEPQGGS